LFVATVFFLSVLIDFYLFFSIGTVNWALPATVGNGNLIFDWIIKFGINGGITQKLLLCTAFSRMFLLGVSMNCGFVGGIIFPYLTMGLISGAIMAVNYPGIPVGLCLGTFMISIACGIVPMPFTFTALSCFVFFFGLYQTVPIFVASLTAYIVVCGSGLFKRLAKNAQPPKNDNASSKQGSMADESKESDSVHSKQEADEFALKQYLGNKKKAGAAPAPTNGSGKH
jgi:H+/Cl- antiporter ClcA